jgi:hypothetical protein
MGGVTQEVFCANGHRLDESPRQPVADRQPCPACGSLARQVKVGIASTVTVRADLELKGKPAGGGKAFMKQKVGASWSYARR